MSGSPIVCRATKDTFARFSVILIALWAFGGYFFYDASSGYSILNANYFSYNAFADASKEASQSSAQEWAVQHQNKGLFPTQMQGGQLGVLEEEKGKMVFYPLPAACPEAEACPPEFLDHALMSKSWNDAWMQYSERMHYKLKPQKGYDATAIQEQWFAGGICILLGLLVIYFMIRTYGRCLSIKGTDLEVAGKHFNLKEVSCIDLRQWGPGYKGCAHFTVKGKKIKADGMTYGGFNAKDGEPAEQFMKAVLSLYQGDIMEYAPNENK